MACPTCDHTMNLLAGEWFWCPRCGTTLAREAPARTVGVPHGVVTVRAWLLRHLWPRPLAEYQYRQLIASELLAPDERAKLEGGR
jgi:tRNA(Ile2) C34 agmatinyltransferase TiaS